MAAAFEGPGHRRLTSHDDGRVQTELAIHRSVCGMHSRRSQRQQPADVLRRDEMPGRAKRVGAQDLSIIEGDFDVRLGRCLQAQSNRPFRPGEVLRLDGGQSSDHALNRPSPWP
jgi:hypothetical protein